MSVASSIKKQLIAKISALSTVNKVYGHEELNPSGFPAVCVTAADMDGEFSSTAENRRIYAYRVTVLFPVGQDLQNITNDRLDNAEDVVGDVVEQILDTMDTDYTLGNYGLVLFVDAVDSTYGYIQYEGGWAKSAELTIRIHTDKNIS